MGVLQRFSLASHFLLYKRLDLQRILAVISTVFMVFESYVTTFIGVVIACALGFLLLTILVPGYLSEGRVGKVLTGTPPNSVMDKTNGLSFKVFMGAILFNFSMGSFVSIIFPFYSKRNQTKDSREPTPLRQKGVTS